MIFGWTEAQVRAALDHADPNTLRMALYHCTGDPALAAMPVEKQSFWGGAFQMAVLSDSHAVQVKERALSFLRDGSRDLAPAPTEAALRAMMASLTGDPVSDFSYFVGRGDLVDEAFPLGVTWRREPPDWIKQAFRVVVIGAGLAGLATAVQLERLGIPYVVIERNRGVGGVWFVNDYPDARVDIASHHYQYSFMKSYPWKHYYATRAELIDYMEAVVSRYGIERNIRFETLLTSATWDEGSASWRLTLRGPDGGEESITANAVISAAGLFNAPHVPDIEGLDGFGGRMFHTTQWDHDYDLAGRRVGLIGVGSSGAQLLPAVADVAAHVCVFQRSPHWVSAIEGYRDPVSPQMQWLFDHLPHFWGWYCYFVSSVNLGDTTGLKDIDPEWRACGGRVSRRNDGLRRHLKAYIVSKFGHDPAMVRAMTPDYPPFAKRTVTDGGWFDALNKPHVELVTDAIERMTPDGVRTVDGVERPLDLIILGSGFKVDRYLWPVTYRGRGGVTLEQAWETDGARAHLAMTVPDFPNLFILYGPNSQARAGGLVKWLELWARYAVTSIVHLIETGGRSMAVRRAVFDDYNARLDEAMKTCVWALAGDRSYYVNDHGRVGVTMPWEPAQYFEWIREPNFDDYDFT